MNLFYGGSKIPWKMLLKNGVTLVDAARKIHETIKKHRGKKYHSKGKKENLENKIADIEDRIKSLEGNEEEKAKLSTDMANQIQSISNNMNIMNSRIILFIWVSIAALVVGIISLLLYIF